MIPIRLEMKNFRSHTHSVVNFDFTSALIVGEDDNDGRKSNGVGKSSIFEGLCWALFGSLKNRQADSVVKWGEPTCEVTLDFMQDQHKYRIVRTRIARYSRMVTQFFKVPENEADFDPEDERYQLHGDTGKMTEKAICEVIKSNYDVFVNSSYFRQNSFFEFAQGTDASRQALLGSLLNLDRWASYRKAAKQQLDEQNDQVKALRRDLDKTEGADEQLKEKQARFKEIKEQAGILKQANAILEEEIASLETKVSRRGKQKADLFKYNELVKKKGFIEDQINSIDVQFEDLGNDVSNLEAQNEKSQQAIAELEQELGELIERMESTDVSALRGRISKMEDAILEGKAKRKNTQARIKNLSDNDECSLCGHEWSDGDAKAEALSAETQELAALEQKLERAHGKLEATKETLEVFRKSEINKEKLENRISTLQKNVAAAVAQVSIKVRKQGELSSKLPELEDDLKSTKELIENMADIEKLKEPDALHSRLEAKKKELKENLEILSSLTFEQGALTEVEKTLALQVKERKELGLSLAAATRMATVYSQLTKAFSREGVPAIIIDNVIEDLTRSTNEWLMQICTKPTRIAFITQKRNNKGDWKETMDIEVTTPTGVCDFADLSGGEQFRVAFGLRLALSSLQSRRMGGETQLLLLDEVSTSLDPYGIDIFVSIIRQLERSMKVLVITHDNNLKDEFERIITVKSDGNGSSTVEM